MECLNCSQFFLERLYITLPVPNIQIFVLKTHFSFQDPASICAEIGLCNSTKKVISAVLLEPAVMFAPKPKIFFPMAPGPVLIGAEKQAKAKPVDTPPKVSVECVVCEFMMKELDGILGENATKVFCETRFEKEINDNGGGGDDSDGGDGDSDGDDGGSDGDDGGGDDGDDDGRGGYGDGSYGDDCVFPSKNNVTLNFATRLTLLIFRRNLLSPSHIS